MNVIDFRSLVFNNAKAEGTPYLRASDVDQLNQLIFRQLNVYASRTQCLQSDAVAFTPIVGQATYDASQVSQTILGVATTVFAKPLCFIRGVIINGVPLTICGDELGRPGESSEFLVSQALPGYQAAANGKPSYWWQEPPNNLRFNCPFDQAYSSCYISGRLYHTPATGQDTQVLDLADEDIAPAARLVSSELLMVYSRDAGVALRKLAEEEMHARFGQCTVKTAGTARRGTGKERTTISLAR